MSFGDNLKMIREFRGHSAPDVIKGTGVSKQKYYAYEAGNYEPSPEIVDQLAAFLKVPREMFYKIKVTATDLRGSNGRSFKDEIFEGDYLGVHKKIWSEMELDKSAMRQALITNSETNRNLSDSLAKAVNKLTSA